MYSFETEILGVTMQVSGEFEPEEPMTHDCPGWPASFEIDTIEHKGEELEVDSFPTEMLNEICDAAFAAASEEAGY